MHRILLFSILTLSFIIPAGLWGGKLFLKTGVGGGYDTSDGGFYGVFRLNAEGLTGEKPYEVFGAVNLIGNLNTNSGLIDGEGTIGVFYTPSLTTVLQALLSYRYVLDINNWVKAALELKYDLTRQITLDAQYKYINAVTLAGIPSESFNNHLLTGGGSFDLSEYVTVDAEVNYSQRNYFQIAVSNRTLKNDQLKAGLTLAFFPDYGLTVRLGYTYSKNMSSENMFYTLTATNQIYQYNSADTHSGFLGLEWNLAQEFRMSFFGQINFISYDLPLKNDLTYFTGMLFEIYLSPSFKIEIPVGYSGCTGTVMNSYDRVRGGVEFYFFL